MGVTATLISAGVGAKTSHDARKSAEKASRQASADAKLEADAAKKEQEEEARKLAESTPTGSMSTSKRIAAQKQQLMRRGGTGRGGTVLSKSNTLG